MVESTAAKIPYYFTAYFAAIVLLLPSWPGVFGDLHPETNAIPLLMLCAIALWMLLNIDELRLFLPTRNILILIVANIFIVSFLRPDVFQSVRQSVATLLSFVIILFLTSLLHSITVRAALWLVSWNLTFAVCLSSLVHLQTVGTMTFLVHSSRTRVGGLFYYADNAMMLSTSILLSVLAFLLSEKKTKALQALLLNSIICSILLASTDTRSVMLALVISLSFILVFSYVQSGVKIICVLFGILMLTSGYLFFDPGGEENTEKILVRQMIWQVSFNGIKEQPLTGYGNKQNFFQSDYQSGKISATLQDAHNAHLMHILYFGIPSWCLFMLFLLTIVRNGLKHYRHEFHSFHSVTIFWILASFFWGGTFLLGSNVHQIMFMVSLLGIVSHPDIYEESTRLKKHDYVYSVSL